MKKQIISTIVLVLSLFVFAGSLYAGTYSGGTGEPNNPYQIAAVADWQELMATPADWSNSFLLIADIDLIGISLIPVGNDNTQFTGVFDGDSHVIRNAVINLPDEDYIGIFGCVNDSGQIRNLGAENVNIIGHYDVGGLVGYCRGLLISCYSTGTVSGTRDEVGGLVGDNSGSITSCYSTGSVRGTGNSAGGLVGWNRGSITSCYCSGDVNGDVAVGGLAGDNGSGSISFCYSTGSVSGASYVGGLVGWNNFGSVTSCFWDIQTSGQTTSDGGTGKTTAEMQTLATFLNASWDFVSETANGLHDFWQIAPNDYPRLAAPDWTLAGDGTDDSPYLVETAAELAKVWLRPTGYYRLTGNLDLSGISWTTAIIQEFAGVFDGSDHVISNLTINLPYDNVGLFGSIGPDSYIRNIGVEDANIIGSYKVGGLVGDNYGSITDCHYTGIVSGGSAVGGLVGFNHQGLITSCDSSGSVTGSVDAGGLVGSNDSGLITSCYSTGTVTGYSHIGGLVGSNSGGTIDNCYSTGTVTGQAFWIGGLVGQSYYGSITSCYSTGSVSTTLGFAGGLVGTNRFGSITSCYATGTVSGSGTSYYVGGLVGDNGSGSISFCYSTGSVSGASYVGGLVGLSDERSSITSCHSIGLVCGNVDVGGLVGVNLGTITYCYSNGNVSGTDKAVGGLVGMQWGTVDSCYATADVTGVRDVGGLIGCNYGSVTSCYATGSVSGEYSVGGLIGTNFLSRVKTVAFCYATGSVSGTGDSVGGLVGYDDTHDGYTTVNGSFWDTQTSGQSTSAAGTGKTTAEMQTLATFTDAGWDFVCETVNGTDDIWFMPPDDYPHLTWEIPPEFNLSVSPTILWPANNKMVKITPAWTATDLCGQPLEVSLVDITMNESGNADDIRISDDGSIYLCATRSGNSKARIYTLTYKACDSSGNCTTKTATVVVPHDMRK